MEAQKSFVPQRGSVLGDPLRAALLLTRAAMKQGCGTQLPRAPLTHPVQRLLPEGKATVPFWAPFRPWAPTEVPSTEMPVCLALVSACCSQLASAQCSLPAGTYLELVELEQVAVAATSEGGEEPALL